MSQTSTQARRRTSRSLDYTWHLPFSTELDKKNKKNFAAQFLKAEFICECTRRLLPARFQGASCPQVLTMRCNPIVRE
jgi:hypothetical protein